MPTSTDGGPRLLVLGGIRSGKSEWAEASIAAATRADAPVRYLATGPAPGGDVSWQQRIDGHRCRRPTHWHTVESGDVAAELRTAPQTATLVDDLGGWLAGVLDRRGWESGSITEDTDDLLAAVNGVTAPLVLVSPEVGLSVVPATASGRRFADELGTLNRRLAESCPQVVLVVAGQPVWIKR